MMIRERIPAIIAVIVSVALFFALLFSVFTDEIETYTCYVTNTGECYHAEGCYYLKSYNETTVYEAKGKYRACSRCNPIKEKYKTTIIERNYAASVAISIVSGFIVYFVSAVLIEKARKKEDI